MTAEEMAKRLDNVSGPNAKGWWNASCPAHDDRRASLGFKQGEHKPIIKCQAGCTPEQVLQAIPTWADATGPAMQHRLTVAAFAADKKLPEPFLRESGVAQEGSGLRITYWREDGTPAPRQRRRTALAARDGSSWLPGEGSPVPYGFWKLSDARQAGWLLLPEGETDALTAWFHNFPCLSLPGAATASYLEAEHLRDLAKIYVLREPDAGGDAFSRSVANRLNELHWQGEALVLAMPIGTKDLNDLHRANPKTFPSRLRASMEAATALLRTPARVVLAPTELIFTSLGDLLREPDEEIAWVVQDRLIAGGFSMLAGKPKAGKSTLARDLAFRVARGIPWLGFATAPGPVFYLGLEEKRSRVKEHFRALGATPEDPIWVFVAPSPRDGLLQLRATAEREKPRLFIIDPLLKMVRVRDANDYAIISAALEPLLALARETGAHILAAHHLGKGDRSGGDAILGSTALFASVDAALLLKRTDRYRTLSTIQRYGTDLEEVVLVLDETTGAISVEGTRKETDEAAAGRAILDFLAGQNQPIEESLILAAVEMRTALFRRVLRQLVADNRVLRLGPGTRSNPYKYAVPGRFGVGR